MWPNARAIIKQNILITNQSMTQTINLFGGQEKKPKRLKKDLNKASWKTDIDMKRAYLRLAFSVKDYGNLAVLDVN
jgi:mRNA-degrading endonuclease HigB of HigAB toxin-antitoxin module